MHPRFRQQTRSWKRRRRTAKTEPSRPADTGTTGTSSGLGSSRRAKPPPCRCDCAASPGEEEEDEEKQPEQAGQWERELRIDPCDRWWLTPIAGVFCPFVCVTWRCFVLYWGFIFVEPLFKHISDTNLAETGDVRWGWCSDASTLPGSAASFRKFLLFFVHNENLRFQHRRWRHDAAIAMALSFIHLVIFLLVVLFLFHLYLWRQSLHVHIFALFLAFFLPVCISLICQYQVSVSIIWCDWSLFHTRVWDSSQFKRLMKTPCVDQVHSACNDLFGTHF